MSLTLALHGLNPSHSCGFWQALTAMEKPLVA